MADKDTLDVQSSEIRVTPFTLHNYVANLLITPSVRKNSNNRNHVETINTFTIYFSSRNEDLAYSRLKM
jgi:hypothetical protein